MKRTNLKVFFIIVIISFALALSGCGNKKVNTDPTVVVATGEPAVVVTPEIVGAPEAKASSFTIGKLKSCFEYAQLSLNAIDAGIEKLKQYNLGKYQVVVEKISPYVAQLREYVDLFAQAIAEKDDAKAFELSDLARATITLIIKYGGPILWKMIF